MSDKVAVNLLLDVTQALDVMPYTWRSDAYCPSVGERVDRHLRRVVHLSLPGVRVDDLTARHLDPTDRYPMSQQREDLDRLCLLLGEPITVDLQGGHSGVAVWHFFGDVPTHLAVNAIGAVMGVPDRMDDAGPRWVLTWRGPVEARLTVPADGVPVVWRALHEHKRGPSVIDGGAA